MPDLLQLEYRSPQPEVRRALSPYAYALRLMNIVAVLLLTIPDGHAAPSLSVTVTWAMTAVALLGVSFAAIRDMHRTGRTGAIAVAFAIGLALLAGTAAVSPNNRHRRERTSSIMCSSYLRQIGVATLQYQSDHGTWPGSLNDLAQLVEPRQLSCPFDNSARRYYYIPPRTDHPSPSVVIAFELPSHMDEMNLLLSDGAVESLKAEAALRALAELAAGLNPPPSMSPAATTTPPAAPSR